MVFCLNIYFIPVMSKLNSQHHCINQQINRQLTKYNVFTDILFLNQHKYFSFFHLTKYFFICCYKNKTRTAFENLFQNQFKCVDLKETHSHRDEDKHTPGRCGWCCPAQFWCRFSSRCRAAVPGWSGPAGAGVFWCARCRTSEGWPAGGAAGPARCSAGPRCDGRGVQRTPLLPVNTHKASAEHQSLAFMSNGKDNRQSTSGIFS